MLQQYMKSNKKVFSVEYESKSKIHMDLAGHFPILLRAGNIYIFIFYDKDSNAILVTKLKFFTLV